MKTMFLSNMSKSRRLTENLKKRQKIKNDADGGTDRRTDGQTDTASCRFACPRPKTLFSFSLFYRYMCLHHIYYLILNIFLKNFLSCVRQIFLHQQHAYPATTDVRKHALKMLWLFVGDCVSLCLSAYDNIVTLSCLLNDGEHQVFEWPQKLQHLKNIWRF